MEHLIFRRGPEAQVAKRRWTPSRINQQTLCVVNAKHKHNQIPSKTNTLKHEHTAAVQCIYAITASAFWHLAGDGRWTFLLRFWPSVVMKQSLEETVQQQLMSLCNRNEATKGQYFYTFRPLDTAHWEQSTVWSCLSTFSGHKTDAVVWWLLTKPETDPFLQVSIVASQKQSLCYNVLLKLQLN